jgi:hypothetical protein
MKNLITMTVLLLVAVTTFAQNTFTVNGLNYLITSTNPNTVTITANTNTGNIAIPSQVTNAGGVTFSIIRIGSNAFAGDGF